VSAALVFGVGVAGRAAARALLASGRDVFVADDAGEPAVDGAVTRSADDPGLLDGVSTLVPAPGVPEAHPVVVAAAGRGVEVVSEIEVAFRIEQRRGVDARPMVAVTGTDGKTTTTLMATSILRAAGRDAMAAGNSGTPLCDAVLGGSDSFVVECSSFALARVRRFRAAAAAWLNFSPDHLDWHADMSSYERAKANIWASATEGDVAVCGSLDPRILAHARAGRARVVIAGVEGGQWYADERDLRGPDGAVAAIGSLSRALPHDLANAAVAAALCVEPGLADADAVREGLRSFEHPPHRIALVAERGGVRYFDDSKATTPHAALTAIRGFDRVVLIAGGRNKGLDLAPLVTEANRIVAVVAIGESAPELRSVFGSRVPSVEAPSMREAVQAAAGFATPGSVVLLSPACASFDWYRNYGQRGDDFAAEVLRLPDSVATRSATS
jgi:UDP-N-acetylmuramoylalanine--D-glutamate ligase